MDTAYRQHLDGMRVRQSHIFHGDTKWYLETANGFIISEGYEERIGAEADLALRRDEALQGEDS